MTIGLDHLIVPVHDRAAAAKLLASLLDVPWSATGIGSFSPVYVNDGLTLDFDEAEGAYPVLHYCFRVDDRTFDGLLARLAAHGIGYRSAAHGPADGRTGVHGGGRLVYWNEPGGHVWEALTVSYARRRE